MDMVLGLERHRGVQPARLLLGPDCSRDRTGASKKSGLGYYSAENPEVFFQNATQRFGRQNSGIKEFLGGSNPKQEGSIIQSKTPRQEKKTREVVYGF